jgi:hypothetical protein
MFLQEFLSLVLGLRWPIMDGLKLQLMARSNTSTRLSNRLYQIGLAKLCLTRDDFNTWHSLTFMWIVNMPPRIEYMYAWFSYLSLIQTINTRNCIEFTLTHRLCTCVDQHYTILWPYNWFQQSVKELKWGAHFLLKTAARKRPFKVSSNV